MPFIFLIQYIHLRKFSIYSNLLAKKQNGKSEPEIFVLEDIWTEAPYFFGNWDRDTLFCRQFGSRHLVSSAIETGAPRLVGNGDGGTSLGGNWEGEALFRRQTGYASV
jgi:hypothetical protein